MPSFSLLPTFVSDAVQAPLLVVMPVYNEEANIAGVLQEWFAELDKLDTASQILVVNDGSKDHTLACLQELEQKWPDRLIIADKLNAGHGATCRLAYEIATRSKCEWVLQIDSDGQCDARYLTDFWTKRLDHDVVLGLRTQRNDGILRKITSKGCQVFSSLVLGLAVPDPNVPYRLIRRTTLQAAMKNIPPNFNLYNVALACVLHYDKSVRMSRVPINFRERAGGESSFDIPRVVCWGLAMVFELLQMKRSLRKKVCR